MLEFLISRDTIAQSLRDQYNWAIIPMINPDGNFNGKTQRNNHGVDLTSQWGKARAGYAVSEIQGCINAIDAYNAKGYRIKAFIDMHCYYVSKWLSFYSGGEGWALASKIRAETHFGEDGMRSYSSSSASVPSIYYEYGASGVLLETTQWRNVLHWTVGDATITNLKTYGQRLAKSLEGF
jgi:hypothetical protein